MYNRSLSFFAVAVILVGCGGGGGGSGGPSGASGPVTITLSDPPSCAAPTGPYTNVWVTITKVRAHVSGSAGSGAGGWVDLLDLSATPLQVDLLNIGNATCLMASLGTTTGLPAGTYQQIRFHLLSNNPGPGEAVPMPNMCAGTGGYNCVVPAVGSPQVLNLGSHANNGIKIPPGRIVGGPLSFQEGETKTINIDFDACRSIVEQGNGGFRLKPTLSAGEVMVGNMSVAGRVVDQATSMPIMGGQVLVTAQQLDASGVGRIFAQAQADPVTGTFSLCPLPTSSYELVVAALDASGVPYAPTVMLQVPVGADVGDVPLTAAGAMGLTNVVGAVTSTTASAMGTSIDAELAVLHEVPFGAMTVRVSSPLFFGSTPVVTTAPDPACPAGTECAAFGLFVGPGIPNVGAYDPGGTVFAASPMGAAIIVEAQATVPGSESTHACAPSTLTVDLDSMGAPLMAAAGTTTTAMTLSFIDCP